MTIDEAIKHCEEVAEYKEAVCKTMENEEGEFTDSGNTYYKYCKRRASEHRQLAEWLRELKDYREREFCRYCRERDTLIFDEPCKSCKIYFVRREVNADADT